MFGDSDTLHYFDILFNNAMNIPLLTSRNEVLISKCSATFDYLAKYDIAITQYNKHK